MRKPGVNHLDMLDLAQPVGDQLNWQIDRHVDITNSPSSQPVTHRAANDAGFTTKPGCGRKNMPDNIMLRPRRQFFGCAHQCLRWRQLPMLLLLCVKSA